MQITSTKKELWQTLDSARDDLDHLRGQRLLIQLYSDEESMTELDSHITNVLCMLDKTRDR